LFSLQGTDETNSKGAIEMTSRGLLVVTVWLVCSPAVALAQSDRFELGAQLISANLSPFDQADFGLGARFSWNPVPLAGLESEINFYPRDLPGEVPFSRRRIEGLFGATFGPGFGSLRPFAKARAGFLSFRAATEPFACILIFPPPPSCQLGDRTLLDYELGGGLELFPSRGLFVRVEVGDRAVRYPGPARDKDGTLHEDSFFGHDLRFAAGAGLRF
jgi:hypothetical protein